MLLCDQFARHVHRARRKQAGGGDVLRTTDALALRAVEAALEAGAHARLSPCELAFFLMPLRHSPNEARLRRALELATAAQAHAAGEADVLHRFIRASASQLDHLLGLAGDPDDILEHGSFTPPPEVLQHASDEPLLRVMDLFLRARGMSPGLAPPPVVVSLSGGVDSMVLTQLLLYLRPLWGFRVVAVHIDYANRSEGGTLPPPPPPRIRLLIGW